MKILITTGIFPPDIGGPSRMVEQLAFDLRRKGLGVAILTFGKKDNEARSYQVERASGKLDFLKKILKLSKEADIIYTFDLYTAGFFSWLIGKRLLGKKLVVRFAGDSAWESAFNKGATFHDVVNFQEARHDFKNRQFDIYLLRKLRYRILKGADKVITVSDFVKKLAEKIGVSGHKTEVIYNSVDFIEFKDLAVKTEELRRKLGLAGKKVIVTAGRLVPWKGIDGLIEAVNQLKKEDFLAVKLIIAGDGPEKDRLKRLVEIKALDADVVFAGRIPQNEVLAYYNLADVFVLNSLYEGLSHVLLEVLSLGKPIIASNCGGNPEVIENEKNGLLVEYNNTAQIILSIKKILTEEKWSAGDYQNLCRKSLKKFSWQKVLEQTIKVFQNV